MRLFTPILFALALLSGCSDEEYSDTAVETTIPDDTDGAVDERPRDNDDDGDGRRDDTDNGSGSDSDDTDSGTDTDNDDDGESQTWYADCDGDGYGALGYTRISVSMPSGDSCDDGGEWVLVAGDCSDSNASAFPGNPEVTDGVDNDCDGTIDEGSSSSNTWYYDADGDGYGLSSVTSSASAMPSGYAAVGGDCNDSSASAHPGGSEGTVADGIDQDCDGSIDEGTTSGGTSSTTGTVTVCVIEVLGDYELAAMNDDGGTGSENWLEDDACPNPLLEGDESVNSSDCAEYEAEPCELLKFNGFTTESEMWGEYMVGDCDGPYLFRSGDICATARITVDGVEITTAEEFNYIYTVPGSC